MAVRSDPDCCRPPDARGFLDSDSAAMDPGPRVRHHGLRVELRRRLCADGPIHRRHRCPARRIRGPSGARRATTDRALQAHVRAPIDDADHRPPAARASDHGAAAGRSHRLGSRHRSDAVRSRCRSCRESRLRVVRWRLSRSRPTDRWSLAAGDSPPWVEQRPCRRVFRIGLRRWSAPPRGRGRLCGRPRARACTRHDPLRHGRLRDQGVRAFGERSRVSRQCTDRAGLRSRVGTLAFTDSSATW
ncbi:hypothetical protein BH11MYX2_BH11MYX2_34330 [soil metagenome]